MAEAELLVNWQSAFIWCGKTICCRIVVRQVDGKVQLCVGLHSYWCVFCPHSR